MTELSPGSWRLKRVRRLASSPSERAEHGVFVVEGPRLVAEAVDAGLVVSEVYLTADATDEVSAVARRAADRGASLWELGPGGLDRIGDVRTSTGILALANRCDTSLASLVEPQFVLVLAGLADPGNVGTLIRAAEAAGADAVVVTDGSVDVFNPKVVRATAGTLFTVPVVRGVDGAAACAELAGLGLRVVGTDADRGEPHTEADLGGPIALVLGNEVAGLEADLPVDGWVRVPIRGRAESLNVAMAGSVLCFEIARQHEAVA